MKLFEALVEKWTCKHTWDCVAKVECNGGLNLLYVCAKCGKMKKIWL
jgi:hypothetical protein